MKNYEVILRQAIKNNPNMNVRSVICNLYDDCCYCSIQNVCKPMEKFSLEKDKAVSDWLKEDVIHESDIL